VSQQDSIPLDIICYFCGIVGRDYQCEPCSNFMRKSRESREFFVIDFGISKQIISETGQASP
jgi:hypothetical protein